MISYMQGRRSEVYARPGELFVDGILLCFLLC
jgi:hypothetical protein